jgi:RNA polymerase sigma-70 factor (ECF subfamily)
MVDPALAELLAERRHLEDVAAWLAGPGSGEAVDEAYRAWYALGADERAAVASPTDWLTREVGRQCLHRLAAPPPHPAAPADDFARRFRAACAAESATALDVLLAEDVTAWFDGGGKLRTADRPVRGRAEVTRAVLALLAPRSGTRLDERSVNGSTGLVVRVDDRVAAVVLWRTRDRVITELWLVLNPAKLRGWPVVTNERAVLS